jgi:voltage-gated potassium channel
MTTKSIKGTGLSRHKAEGRPQSRLKKLYHHIDQYFDLPLAEPPTLPESLVTRTGLSSWPLAALLIGASFYLVFILAAYLDGFTLNLFQNESWWYSLFFPILTIYLLLMHPLLRRLLAQSIQTYRAMVPDNDRFRRLETEAYSLHRRREWIAFGLGTLAGWLIINPWGERLTRAGLYLSQIVYEAIGDMLVFGLLGWHIYSALTRTKILTTMHSQIQDFNLFKEAPPMRPIFQWAFGVAASLLGAVAVSTIFIPRAQLFNPTTILVYIIIGIAATVALTFSKVPASFLSQFRILRALILFMLVAAIGTIGFHQFENWDLVDSFYATIITMTTVGYGDFSPATDEGRLFTIFLSLIAVGVGGYAITSIASFVIEGNFHRFIQGKRVDKQIVRMKEHYILCGAGRMGRQIAVEFYKTKVPFVVIEQSPGVLEELLREVEIPYVQGDATQDDVLRLAGVERARGLVATLSDDKDNVFITLSARSLNPNLRIISRVSLEKNRKKLQKAGANVIISPDEVSGRRMVSEMFHSEVVTLLDEMLRAEEQTGQTLRLEEIHVDDIKVPALVERLEREELCISHIGQRTELMVVAIKRDQLSEGGDPYIYTPRGHTKLHHGDILIVIGTPEQRIKLQHEVLTPGNLSRWISTIWD